MGFAHIFLISAQLVGATPECAQPGLTPLEAKGRFIELVRAFEDDPARYLDGEPLVRLECREHRAVYLLAKFGPSGAGGDQAVFVIDASNGAVIDPPIRCNPEDFKLNHAAVEKIALQHLKAAAVDPNEFHPLFFRRQCQQKLGWMVGAMHKSPAPGRELLLVVDDATGTAEWISSE